MDEFQYDVYVQTNADGYITAVNSSAFADGSLGTKIDSGTGEKYRHAQDSYFSEPLATPEGVPRYKLDGTAAAVRPDLTEAVAAAQKAAETAGQIAALKAQLAATDYVACKIAEGAATVEDYAEAIEKRAAWREQINVLEG